nr:E3 ubiquitin-protein ligase FANCL-like isoform X3 [Cherax quadricarinatus]XP_053633744.1 E3 ubiquitin-protein ligase FANCL-like isoform X3 [Cherax quadricarinatus]
MAVSDLCTKFPLLCISVSSGQPHSFSGFISIGDIDYAVYLSTPHFPLLKGLTLSTDAQLSSIIHTCQAQLSEVEKTCSTVLEYLIKFQHICSSSQRREQDVEDLSLLRSSHLRSLLSHLEVVGWSRVTQISPDFTSISLEARDEKGRSHLLQVRIGSGYPQEPPCVEADMPLGLKVSWNSVEGLSCIVSAWEDQLKSLQLFWDVLDELDEMVLVLDPQNPTRRHTTRRILLSNHVSVQLCVSVAHPRSLPQCHFLGTSRLTAPLNALLTEKYEEWDPDRSIVSNLEAILGVSVVKSRSADSEGMAEEWSAECAVCYSLHLEDALPDLTCDHCSQAFHVQCLYEWLCNLTNSRQSMNVIFGECPYCTQLISCKVHLKFMKIDVADYYHSHKKALNPNELYSFKLQGKRLVKGEVCTKGLSQSWRGSKLMLFLYILWSLCFFVMITAERL